ncbi:MAG: hypothetical protein QXY49_07080, partial [Thermofilaceae archaeon]
LICIALTARGSPYSVPLTFIGFVLFPSHLLAKSLAKAARLEATEASIVSSTLLLLVFSSVPLACKALSLPELAPFVAMTVIVLAITALCGLKSERSPVDMMFLLAVCAMLIAFTAYAPIERTYSPDETLYIRSVQLTESYGVVVAIIGARSTPQPLLVDVIEKYLWGRFLWTSFLYAVRILSGVSHASLHLSSLLFLSFLAYAVKGLLSDVLRIHQASYVLLAVLLTILLPASLPWSVTAFLDLAQAYFFLSSAVFLLNSINLSNGVLDFDLTKAFISTVILLLSATLKPNLVFNAFLILLTAVVLIWSSKKYKLTHNARIALHLSKITILITLAYMAIDFMYSYSALALADYNLASFFRGLLILPFSTTAYLLKPLLQYLGSPKPSFTPDSLKNWIYDLTCVLTPEAVGLPASALLPTAFLPLLPWLKGMDELQRMKIKVLAVAVSLSFWTYFFLLRTSRLLMEVNRYGISLYVIAAALSFYMVHRLDEMGWRHELTMTFLLLSACPLFLKSWSIVEYGATEPYYGIPRHKASVVILFLEYLALLAAMLPASLMQRHLRVRLRVDAERATLVEEFSAHIVVLTLFPFIIMYNSLIVEESWLLFYGSPLAEITSIIESILDGRTTIIVSNFHLWLQIRLGDRFTLVAAPQSEQELKAFISAIPSGSLIALTDDPYFIRFGTEYMKEYTYNPSFHLEKLTALDWLGSHYILFRKVNGSSTLGGHIEVLEAGLGANGTCVIRVNSSEPGQVILSSWFISFLVNITPAKEIVITRNHPITHAVLAPYICRLSEIVSLKSSEPFGRSLLDTRHALIFLISLLAIVAISLACRRLIEVQMS